jgi:hypothetical protein
VRSRSKACSQAKARSTTQRCGPARYSAARELSEEQPGALAALITGTDPRDHGFAVALWTREIVRS